jgi:hypothetical protein
MSVNINHATDTLTASGGTLNLPGFLPSMATNRLLGRTTAGTGIAEEISIGSGLSLTAGSLSATGGGGSTDLVIHPFLLSGM